MVGGLKKLERYTLKYNTILKYAKHFNKTFEEMKSLLFEQDVTPGQININVYRELKEKGTEYIAKFYKCSVSTINKAVANQHLNKPLFGISKRELKEKVEEGMSVVDMAKHYGVCYDKMLRYLKEQRVVAKVKRANLSTRLILSLHNKRFTIQEIAQKMECTSQSIRYHLNKE